MFELNNFINIDVKLEHFDIFELRFKHSLTSLIHPALLKRPRISKTNENNFFKLLGHC